jgi:hypothetical protein
MQAMQIRRSMRNLSTRLILQAGLKKSTMQSHRAASQPHVTPIIDRQNKVDRKGTCRVWFPSEDRSAVTLYRFCIEHHS